MAILTNYTKYFSSGPPKLPVYGAFWIVLAHAFEDLATAFRKLGERYNTNLVGLYMGPVPTVVINDPGLIKEMLNREEFDGRMDIILFRLRSFWKKLGELNISVYTDFSGVNIYKSKENHTTHSRVIF